MSRDLLPKERENNKGKLEELIAINPHCAACGKPSSKINPQSAHIIALVEGGKTKPDNLVLLCSQPFSHREGPGCHELFERRFVSVEEIRDARQQWANQSVDGSLRATMVERRLEQENDSKKPQDSTSWANDVCQPLIQSGHWLKALCCLEKALDEASSDEDRFILRVRMAEVHRRRAATDAIKDAYKVISELSTQPIPPRGASRFFYERGYVSLIVGHHLDAIADLQRSRDTAEDQTFWVAKATWVWINALISGLGDRAPWDEIQSAIEKIKPIRLGPEDPSSNRWYLNSLIDKVRMHLVRGENALAPPVLKDVHKKWDSMHIRNGWDRAFRPFLLLLSAQVELSTATSPEAFHRALELLARYLSDRLPARRNPGEHLRDALFATASCLNELGHASHAVRTAQVAERTRDGVSWINPYRKPSS